MDMRVEDAAVMEQPRAMPDVSVVICTYNRPALMERALASALAQATPSGLVLEVVVVDNSAEGNAADTVARLAGGAAAAVRYVHATPSNIAVARNAGVAAARGSWIAFLDDDEEAAPGWIAALLGTAEQTGADFVFGPVEPVFAAGSPPSWDPSGSQFRKRLNLPDGADAPVHGALGHARSLGTVGTCNVLIRRNAMGDGTPFDPAFGRSGGEDSDFFRRRIRAGHRAAWAADALVSEVIPADRSDFDFMVRRTFKESQTHVRLLAKHSERPWWTAGQLMARGLLQATLWAPAQLLRRWLPPSLAAKARLGFARGTGKLLWRRDARHDSPLYN